MGKKSVYAVYRGRKTGTFNSWPECQEQVEGFSGAFFQKFSIVDETCEAIQSRTIMVENQSTDACATSEDQVIHVQPPKEIENLPLFYIPCCVPYRSDSGKNTVKGVSHGFFWKGRGPCCLYV
ncbi:hypothetical protein Ddye_002046 [Dipteronia dyeriana]|uniref:Ribonuclease H1 N-terminal domain-containing protein n=1 Tax=Dipteronia dyeriana TaxID=168575 RepID=A0AAD9XQ79_9ROSI|nr:hypothetical protein Ddye_002046 [Dipteronia dyeriana]